MAYQDTRRKVQKLTQLDISNGDSPQTHVTFSTLWTSFYIFFFSTLWAFFYYHFYLFVLHCELLLLLKFIVNLHFGNKHKIHVTNLSWCCYNTSWTISITFINKEQERRSLKATLSWLEIWTWLISRLKFNIDHAWFY